MSANPIGAHQVNHHRVDREASRCGQPRQDMGRAAIRNLCVVQPQRHAPKAGKRSFAIFLHISRT